LGNPLAWICLRSHQNGVALVIVRGLGLTRTTGKYATDTVIDVGDD